MNKRFMACLIALVIILIPIAAFAAPVLTDFTKNGTQNEDVTFTAEDFTENYTDEAEITGIRFPTLPEATDGVLNIADTAATAGGEILVADLSSIVFVPATDFTGTVEIAWEATNGTDYSEPATISIDIAPIEEETETPSPSPTDTESPSPTDGDPPTFEYLDMSEHWATAQALEMAHKNILRGEQVGGNFYFEPRRPVNRGDFVRFLNASLGITLSTPNDDDFEFTDKDTMPAWMYKQGMIAYEAGIISGVGEPAGVAFDPYAPLSRIEAIKMLDNILQNVAPSSTQTLTFIDSAQIPGWGVASVQSMVAANVVSGYEDNTLRPHNPMLREDSVVMISNMLEHSPEAATTAHIFTSKIAE